MAHSWSKKISSRHPREYSSECGLPGIAILAPRLGSIQQSSMLKCLRLNNLQGGNKLSADRQSPPINTPLAMTLPTRGKRSSSTHQWAGTHPSHEKICMTPGATSATTVWTPEARATAVLQSEENRPQTQKIRQNQMAKKCIPDEGPKPKNNN